MLARLTLLASIVALGMGAAPPHPPALPQRIVSVDLCADQLVLELADRGQIAGLSRNAADPALSARAAAARGLPRLANSAEALLVANPDMVVAIPMWFGSARAALDPRRFRLVEAPAADSYAGIVTELRQVGAAVGHRERVEAIIRAMDLQLAGVSPRAGQGKVAAYYQRRGYLTGTGTLVDDLMRRVGLVNLATKLGKPPLSQLTLEELVAAKPDYLILESATATVSDQGTEMLHHPALRGIRKLWLPQPWTVCGVPEYARAAQSLAAQMRRHDR